MSVLTSGDFVPIWDQAIADADEGLLSELVELAGDVVAYMGTSTFSAAKALDEGNVLLVRCGQGFEDYARQMAEDCFGYDLGSWPASCVDWERAAAELQHDYTTVDWGNGEWVIVSN